MASIVSAISHLSEKSQKVLEEISKKSEQKIYQLEGDYNQDVLNSVWTAFGAYLSRQIRLGRAITIPKFGVITFSAPEFKLEGVTNPSTRDIRYRKPVFIVSKDFGKGINCKPGIYTSQGIRPYSVTGIVSGVGTAKVNYTEIGSYCDLDKDSARVMVERFIKELAEKARQGSNVEMDIPNLGTFYIKSNIAAIAFNGFLVNDVIDVTNKSVREKKSKDDNLTINNLQRLMEESKSQASRAGDEGLDIDETALNYLKTNLNIDVDEIRSIVRPKTAGAAGSKKFSKTDKNFDGRSVTIKNGTFEKEEVGPGTNAEQRPKTAVRLAETENNGPKITPLESALRKIKFWIRAKSLLSEDAFLEIASFSLGPGASLRVKLNLEELEKGVDRAIGLHLNKEETIALFKYLDSNNTQSIDLAKWKKEFTEERTYLNYIRDVVAKYNLQTDDVLRRMELHKDHPPIDITSLTQSLILLDPSLNVYKAEKVANELLGDHDEINMITLIRALGCPEETGPVGDDWYHRQLRRIKSKVQLSKLRERFEALDKHNQGILDTSDFKTVLMRMKIGLSLDEVNRFTRYIEKDINQMIDYYKFLNALDDIPVDELEIYSTQNQAFDRVQNLSMVFCNYLKDTNLKPIQIVKKALLLKQANGDQPQESTKKVPLSDFAEFVSKRVFKGQAQRELVDQLIERVDVDRDGFIGEFDIETFIARYGYLESKETLKKTVFGGFKGTSELFPKNSLSEEKVEVVLRDLRMALNNKHMSIYDFIRTLDLNENGFITIDEFSKGLDKVIKLSQPAKDGLFAYLDKMKIGMVDYPTIQNLLKRTAIDKKAAVSEDNFDWQYATIKQIKEWVQTNKLKSEDAFRIADADFDGFVSKEDLEKLLTQILKIPKEEVTSQRIDRLFKLMDIFKRGTVQATEFKKFIEEDLEQANNATISGGKTNLFGRSTFDWRLHAKQQIGLFLSKKYESLHDSFEDIAEHNVRLTLKHFTTWIENNQVLNGFNLTEKLMQQLFADIDPHKKGYLTELDWENTFGGYNTKNQFFNEILEALNTQFSDVVDAFEYFLSHEQNLNQLKRELSFTGFKSALDAILPKRFNTADLEFVWKKLSPGSDPVTITKFTQVFDNRKYSGNKVNPVQKTLKDLAVTKRSVYSGQIPANLTAKIQTTDKLEHQQKVVERLRQILAASSIPLEEFYRQIDTDGDGVISNLEFIHAFRKLNLGLSLNEINELLMYFDRDQDGKVTFAEMVSRFKPDESDGQIFSRSKNKLKQIKENIYSYMLSPKDAFHQFNEDRTGKLTYTQFNKLISTLCTLAREQIPSFTILKDLFDFIDIRRDGIIDLGEWMQSFRLVENEEKFPRDVFAGSQPRRPQTATVGATKTFSSGFQNSLLKKHTTKAVEKLPQVEIRKPSELSRWECSKEYDDVMKCIGRNRKILISSFKDIASTGKPITVDVVKGIVDQVLRSNNLKVDEGFWPYLLKFAEKDGIVDYKFMLEVFRERTQALNKHPKVSVIGTQ